MFVQNNSNKMHLHLQFVQDHEIDLEGNGKDEQKYVQCDEMNNIWTK